MDEKRKLSRRGFVGAAGGAAAAASLGPLVPGAASHGRGGRRGDRLLPRNASASSCSPCATRWRPSGSRRSSAA